MWRSANSIRRQLSSKVAVFGTKTTGTATATTQANTSTAAARSNHQWQCQVRAYARHFSSENNNTDSSANEELQTAAADTPVYAPSGMTDEEYIDELLDQKKKDDEHFKAVQNELDERTGRIWSDPWEIGDDDWMNPKGPDDVLDWSPEYVSRIAQERVQVHPDGIPTLETIAKLALPSPLGPLPGKGQAKAYAKQRARKILDTQIRPRVIELAAPRAEQIRKLPSWDDKQDAIDELFESVEAQLKESEEILGLHPHFGEWVEQSLEDFLRSVSDEAPEKPVAVPSIATDSTEATGNAEATSDATITDGEGDGNGDEPKSDDSAVAETAATANISADNDDDAQPVFMDCVDSVESSGENPPMVPSILTPLEPHPHDGPGRMVEEWELAANHATKRIMLRQSTRAIAQALTEKDSSLVYVHGEKGVGKSATLAAVVASARASGHIVLFLPDGDRLRKNGFYITSNRRKKGVFDLPDLSQELCAQLLTMHSKDLKDMSATHATIEEHFTEAQIQKIDGYSNDGMSLVQLLQHAADVKAHAPMCYSIVVDHLMQQDQTPFLMVLDQFNCYYDQGHYFHMDYDDEVRDAIPYDHISLFAPAMHALALRADEDDLDDVTEPQFLKRGGIVVSTTESHAVRHVITNGMLASAQRRASSIDIVEVERFSDLEVDHILANFEATGVGKLRMDRGDTLLDGNEVAYLKMVSGRIGQRLLDASIM